MRIIIILSNITGSFHDIAENCSFGVKQQSLTQSLSFMKLRVIKQCGILKKIKHIVLLLSVWSSEQWGE